MYTINLFSNIDTIVEGIEVAGGINNTFTFASFDEALAFGDAARNAGFNYLYSGGGASSFSNVIGASAGSGSAQYGLSAVGTTAVQTGVNTTEVTVSGLAPEAGLNVVDGGVTAGVAAAQLAGAVAIGAGIGLKSYHDYPEFWTDLSESLFDGIGGNEVMPVIMRATTNGGIKTYVRKSDIDSVVDKMYDLVDMNPSVEIDPFTPDVEQPIITSDANAVEMGNLAILKSQEKYMADGSEYGSITPPGTCAATYNRAMTKFHQDFPDSVPNYAYAYSTKRGGTTPYTSVEVCVADVPDNSTAILRLLTDSLLNRHVETNGEITANHSTAIDRYNRDGTFHENTYLTSGSRLQLFGGIWNYHDSDYGFSAGTLNSTVHATPAVIYNNNTEKSPDKESFWTVFEAWRLNGFKKPYYNPSTRTNEEEEYLPLDLTYTQPDEDQQPNPDNQAKAQTGDAPQPTIDPLIEALIGTLPPWFNVPSDPIGDTPTPTPPAPVFEGAPGLWAIYNPTKQEIADLGAYLWTSNIVDIIEQFFKNSPLEAIISLHMIYCTPTTGAAQNIRLGYLDSGVSADVVTEQYETIDCGTVNIAEHFGDSRDYTDTTVEIFLPFIGMRRLNTADIVGAGVNVVYTIDVLTGTVLCQIFVTKNNTRQCLYQFEGNCSVQIPLTAADRSRLVSGTLSTVAMGLATGGVGAVAGAIGGFSKSAMIERTGSLSGNSGAMAIKIPYIVITRKKANPLGDYYRTMGAPASYTSKLKDCSGYTVVRSVQVEGLSCSDVEKDAIKRLLLSGIII